MSQTYNLFCLSEALSPITHMGGTEGNEAILARESVVTPAGVQSVPVLSANQIRHRMVREPGMRWLIDEYDLKGKLTLAQFNFLFHGGALTDGGATEDLKRIVAWQRLFPLGRLLGGTLPDQILAGSLQCWRGVLVCEENRRQINAILPSGAGVDARLRPAVSFVDGYQYTRSGMRNSEPDLLPENAEGDAGLMIFAGQAVIRGSLFVHGFTLPNVREVELGALLWSLELWARSGGTLGGMAARGHGRFAMSIHADEDIDFDAAIAAYQSLARSVKDEAVAWLFEQFKPRKEDAKKPAKREAAKAKPAKEESPQPALLGLEDES